MSERKLLFFDIDGTLLAGGLDGYIPQSALRALTLARERGHYLWINSGRTYAFMPKPIRDFPFDGYAGGCGTEIIFRGRTLYHHGISGDAARRLIRALRRSGVQAVLEGRHSCYYDETVTPYPPITYVFDIYKDMDVERPLRPFGEPEIRFEKFVAVHRDGDDFEGFLSEISGDFDLIPIEAMGSYHYEEFVPKAHSKATAIDFITRHLHADLEDCYAFGDSNNDLSMLTHVKHGVAMGNSSGDLFKHVKYITTPIDRDGIMLAMKHYRLC